MLKKWRLLLSDLLEHKKEARHLKIVTWLGLLATVVLTICFLTLPAVTVEENKASDVGIALGSPSETKQEIKKAELPPSTSSSSVTASKATETSTSAAIESPFRESPLTFRGSGYTMTLTMTKEAKIPLDAQLQVGELTSDQARYRDYKEKALNQVAKKADEVKNFKLYDIKIISEGKEVEPATSVKVEVAYDKPLLTNDEDLKIVHFKDDGQTEVLHSKDSQETQNTNSDVAFKTNSFSIYAIVQADNTQVPRITYHFQNADGTNYTFLTNSGLSTSQQILKNGDSLAEVGIPTIKPGEHFQGWYLYDTSTGKYGEPVTFGQPVNVTETKEVYVRPVMSNVATITLFDDAAGTHVYERYEVPLDNSGKGTADLSDFKVDPPTSTLLFVGWSKTLNGTALSDSEMKALPVTGNMNLYPVFKESHKIDFETGDLSTGVTYIAPKRLVTDQLASTVKPADPTRKGFAFAGWYTAATGGTLFDFNQVLTSDITLYAHWTPAQTTYTINYWQQSAGDSKTASDAQKTYEYAGQMTKTGLSNSMATITSADITAKLPKGFKVNNTKTQTTVLVKDDGSSVVNVFYDRELVTLLFAKSGYNEATYLNSTFPWNNPTYAESYTGLYGTTLAANGYQWKTGSWRLLTNSGTSGMSYLGEFVVPDNVLGSNTYVMKLYPTGQRIQTYWFYKQGLDGKYTLADTGGGSGADVFTFTEKYIGFNVKYYQRFYQNNNLFDQKSQQTSVGTTISVSEKSYDNFGTPYKDYLNLSIGYERMHFKLQYLDPLDNTPLPNFSQADVLYEQNLQTYKPDTSTVQPKPSLPGYVWDGKWYKDQAQTQEFNFNTTMPAHDTKVYAGWKKIKYKVNIDPNGGQLASTDETYLDLYYGDKVPEYTTVSRDYIADPAGSFYYKYDSRGKDPDSTKRAFYTQNTSLSNVDTSTKYKSEKDAYKLIGWYYVNPDGSLRPYNFTGAVTQDITIKAMWRRAGDYHVIYSNNALGLDGNPIKNTSGQQITTSDEPTDPDTYADGSHSALLRRPTIPNGYRFRGWWYNGKVYNPYDSILIDAHLADANKNITIYPVIIPVDHITLADTSITYDGNGGSQVSANGSVVTQVKSAPLDVNSTTTIPENQYFTRVGYNLIGWNHDKDLANVGDVEFRAGQEVGLDNKPDSSNTLYAVWQPKTYTVKVTKKVVGIEEDKTKNFIFDVSDTLQQGNFALKDGQTKEFINIPYGTSISVKEQPSADFKASEQVSERNLVSGEADKTYNVNGDVNLTVQGDVDITYTNTRVKQKVRIDKVNVENMNEHLAGASFDVYGADAAGNKNPTPLYTHVTTNQEGFLIVGHENYLDLPLGKYYFTETAAPPGYNLPKDDIATLVISSGVTLDQNGNNATPTKETLSDGSIIYSFKVTNSKGRELPSTGGIGVHVFVLVGLTLVVPAGIILYRRKHSH
ncbi:InlB B-repeat-containing protein [Streptococcus pseudoporcinus]|uniref:PI-2b ancillary protein 1 n=1 Tax=Streptococcus pseudoporcinus LQ 940-04 TaxID=875093 RepID=G5K9J6_9STRE|nr:InlB B-repeat-containing protein [Streptococcus pseudoporcinus]EFR43704.1 repeat protein [Streptococcus pseudoporcinus SPIN 20026]EHI64176.1 hypothetical protein STRPS_0740 [Streptococcus pseudoporcinus LQ 940-04]VEF93666.1 PI-2b ancillary protein 1 [Streptococcus pseudoporcinus]